MNWLDGLVSLKAAGEACVIVTIVAVDGSAPRGVGAKMIVSTERCFGSIGGGNLEYQTIAEARSQILRCSGEIVQKQYSLGKDLSQCCGGRVTVLFEQCCEPPLRVALFGAGHVGSCIVDIMAKLDCLVTVYDSRTEYIAAPAPVSHVRRELNRGNTLAVEACKPATAYIVMTHNHDDDFEIVESILSRGDARFCGLIASRSKAESFRRRLRRKQFSDAEIAILTAPLGRLAGAGVSGSKEPMAVAVAVVAQLLELAAGNKQAYRRLSQSKDNSTV